MDATFTNRLNAAVSLELPISGSQISECIYEICNEQLVDGDESLRDILKQEQTSPSPSCGRIFRQGELIYHCKDCAIDDTCVLCSDCFQTKDHEGHRYHYYLSKASGGSCDCGELESWKTSLSCPKHLEPIEASLSSQLLDSEKLLVRARQVFAAVMGLMAEKMEHFLGNTDDGSDDYSVVLLNDEKHSFPQVIEIVCAATGKSQNFARQIAVEVDQQGFTSVLNYQKSTGSEQAERIQKVISSIGLRVSLERSSIVSAGLILNGLINWLAIMAREYPSLRQLVMEAALRGQCSIDGTSRPVVELLFTHERQLRKFYRMGWQDLFTAGLQFDFVKMTLLDHYVRYGVSLIQSQLIDKEPHLGNSHFAVQILTVPSVAQAAARRGFVKTLYNAMTLSEAQTYEDHTILASYISALVQMLRYVAADDSVVEMCLLHDEEHWKAFMAVIRSYDMSFPFSRVIGDHVLYENDDWLSQINISVLLLGFIADFSSSFPTKESILQFMEFMGKYELPDEQNSGRYSFQQPSVWLLGSLLQRYRHVSGDDFAPLQISSNYASRVMDCLSFLAEARSGYWIRNGIAVRAQAEIAVTSTAINSLYLTVFWHACTFSPNVLCRFLEEAMPIVPKYQDEQTNVTIIQLIYQQVVLATFCGSDIEMDPREALDVAIVQVLATGPKTFSGLKRQVAELHGHGTLDAALLRVANLLESDSILASAQYHLKSEAMHKFNQYYWGFQASIRQKTLEFMQQRFKVTPLSLVLTKQYPNSRPLRKLFSTLGYYTLQHVMQHCLQGPSYLKLLDCFVALASFFQQITGSLEECVQGRNQIQGHDGDDVFKKERTKTVLVEFVRQSDVECREELVNLFSQLIAGFDVPMDVDESAKIQGRELAEARRKKMMDSMKQAQEAFSCTNMDALTADNELVEMEHVEMVENGTCVVCTEPADYNTEKYGLASHAVDIALRTYQSYELPATIAAYSSLISCFHLMHQSCYNRLKQSSDNPMVHCPLCSFPAYTLFPVVQNPSLMVVTMDLPRIAKSLDDDTMIGLIKKHYNTLTLDFLDQAKDIPTRALSYLAGCAQQLCFLENGSEVNNVLRMANSIRASIFSNQSEPEGQKVAKKDAFVFIYRMYLNFSELENLEEGLPYLVSLMRLQIFSKIFSILMHVEKLELLTTWRQELYSMVTMDVKELVILVNLWFDLPALNIPKDARWLFPEFEEADDSEFIWKLMSKSKDIGTNIDLTTMVQKIVRPIYPVTFMQLPEDYSDLVTLDREYCEWCSLGKASLLCLFCHRWVCANPSCRDDDYSCPTYEFSAEHSFFSCYGSQSMVLDVNQCAVILSYKCSPDRQDICAIPAPYVDKHGETALGFK